jgi:hypothetical protein
MSSPNNLGELLSYEAHRLEISGRSYVLLPKLNKSQIAVLKDHFRRRGFSIDGTTSFVARNSKAAIHIEHFGLCWSSTDPSDQILPIVPELLECEKERLDFDELLGHYLMVKPGSECTLRFNSRLESMGNWDFLRSTGKCGLTPDEQAVFRRVLRMSSGTCSVVTDFPSRGSTPLVIGSRFYHRTELPAAQAAETLRTVGDKGTRNSYLPRDGLLELPDLADREWDISAAFPELGDWCPFTLA